MLRSRVIPCLLIHKKGLVKTIKFRNPKYVGDPINAVKIFNEKEVDELALFDISITKNESQIDFDLLKDEIMAIGNDMDLSVLGFDEQELANIIDGLDNVEPELDEQNYTSVFI